MNRLTCSMSQVRPIVWETWSRKGVLGQDIIFAKSEKNSNTTDEMIPENRQYQFKSIFCGRTHVRKSEVVAIPNPRGVKSIYNVYCSHIKAYSWHHFISLSFFVISVDFTRDLTFSRYLNHTSRWKSQTALIGFFMYVKWLGG